MLATALFVSGPSAPAATPSMTIQATVRDFARGDLPGGHPDFNTSRGPSRKGLTYGLVERELGEDGVPVYATVRPSLRNTGNGENDPFTTEANFDQWYRDVPGVNQTFLIELKLGPSEGDSSILTTEGYNDKLMTGGDEGGYFPIDNRGFGNEGYTSNFSFTTQITVPFSYIAGSELNFSGDDDVWAFINGKLVIDLGGIHDATPSKVILLDSRMFVETATIPVGGIVHEVDAAYQSRLQTDWSRLGMPGALPIEAGTHGWVDLGLDLGDDHRANFSSDGLEVTVFTAGPPPTSVRLIFDDGRAEVVAWQGNGATYTGSGTANGQPIASIDLVTSEGILATYSAAGRVGSDSQLDFFHAERQWKDSNFILETTLLGAAGNRASFVGYD